MPLAYKVFSEFILIRYLISGGIGVSVTIGGLYILHGIFGLWYLSASALAFICATCVSFVLQKYWTFQNKETSLLKSQFTMHVLLVFLNLGANITLMYLFVDVMGIWYLLSQALTALVVASWSFLLYRHLIFSLSVSTFHAKS